MAEYSVARLDEIDEIDDGRIVFRAVRHHFGIRTFGINAMTARADGDRLIGEHDETEPDSSEELYVVVSGHASFEVDGASHDAPAGTLEGRRASRTSPAAGNCSRRCLHCLSPATTRRALTVPRRSSPTTGPTARRSITTPPVSRVGPGGSTRRSPISAGRSSSHRRWRLLPGMMRTLLPCARTPRSERSFARGSASAEAVERPVSRCTDSANEGPCRKVLQTLRASSPAGQAASPTPVAERARRSVEDVGRDRSFGRPLTRVVDEGEPASTLAQGSKDATLLVIGSRGHGASPAC